MSIGIVPISSRKSVPPFAMSKYPFFAVSAPVKAPFSCPNRRDAASSRGNAPQLTATNLPSRPLFA